MAVPAGGGSVGWPTFSRLLDLAYYLFFGGGILSSLDLTEHLSLAGAEDLSHAVSQIALLLLLIGVAHAGNLLLLPVVGLMFSSVIRRANRHTGGDATPPTSLRAARIDRLAATAVIIAMALALVLVMVAAVISVLGV